MTFTYRQKRGLQAFRAFAKEFPLEQAVISAKKSVRMPDEDWDGIAGEMADIAAELNAAGLLADTATPT